MECRVFEKYLKGKDCCDTVTPPEVHQHLIECEDCQHYNQLILALNSEHGLQEKAPEDILPAIEMAIFNSVGRNKNKEPWGFFNPLLKPAFAGFFIVLVAIVSYTFLADKNAGYVENLSTRFKLAKFENIASGDMLYTGDHTTAAIRLKNKNKLQIHQNTIVKIKDQGRLALSRGEISLLTGDKQLQIETPGGLLLAKNATIKITTVARMENGLLKTETTCIVYDGNLLIKSPLKEMVLNHGQKATIAENGSITSQKQLTAAESENESSTVVKHKLFAAVAALCDCIHAVNYTPDKKGDHLGLFGKEVDENKFKVHVFWREKGLHELGFRPLNEPIKLCSVKTRRIHA